jgi:AraC-like DNA-binding protein
MILTHIEDNCTNPAALFSTVPYSATMQTIILSSSVSAIILSLLLLYFRRENFRTVIFLSLTLICLSIIGLTHTVVRGAGPVWLLAILFNSATPLYFLVGPFLFFHVRSVLNDRYSIARKEVWHFVPAFLVILNNMPYFVLPFKDKKGIAQSIRDNQDTIISLDINLLFSFTTVALVRPVIIIIYAVAGAFLLYTFSKNRASASLGDLPASQVKSTFNWLLFFCGAVMLLAFGNLVMGYVFVYYPNLRSLNLTILLQALVVFSIPASLLFFPQVLYGIPIPSTMSRATKPIPRGKRKEPEVQISFDELALLIQAVMETEKPYLQTDFTLEDLAILMKVPKHHLYYCFNEVMKVKFVDLRTDLRVAHAKELLKKIHQMNITIEAVGEASGFSSRSSFYRSFKDKTGLTPSDFVKGTLQAS